MKKFVSLVLLTLFTATLGFAQSSARVVKYQPDDIIAIKAKLRYTTLIQLPVTEKILEVATGDKDFWIIDALQNLCFLHPAKAGIKSNLNLITDKGNVYSFTLEEVTGDPDLKVLVEPSNSSALATVNQTPQLVPAAEVEALGAQAQMLRLQADQAVTQFNSEATEKFTVYDVKDSKPNLVNFELKDGTYVLPKVVDSGYLEIGKKHLTFERKQQ
jgi:type IV secretion system protein VirB9